MPPISKFAAIMLYAALLLFSFIPALAQDVVSVPVTVTDRGGKLITGLKAQDFALYQDGEKQKIDFFAPKDEPFNVAILLDTSRSTFPVLKDLQNAAKDFIHHLRGQDRAMIVSVDRETQVLQPLTNDRNSLERTIQGIQISEHSNTILRDGIAEVLRQHLQGIKGRKAVIVLTDGNDRGSLMNEPRLKEIAASSDTLIYAVFFVNVPQPRARAARIPRAGRVRVGRRGGVIFSPGARIPRAPRPRADSEPKRREKIERIEAKNERIIDYLVELSEGTGGHLYTSDVKSLKKTLGKIAEELHKQYRLGFSPTTNKGAHTLRIEVARPDALVRARRKY